MNDAIATLPKLVLERALAAPPALVWRAWTDPAGLARWWGPEGFSAPTIEFEARPGGRIRIEMLGPDGARHPMDGEVLEASPPARLVFVSGPLGPDGKRLFDVLTTLELGQAGSGTRLRLETRVTAIHDPAAEAPLAGMEQGWNMSLDRLGTSLAPQRAVHDSFTIERRLAAPPAKVFNAWSDTNAKARWFTAPRDGWTQRVRELDCRPGGSERLCGEWKSGQVTDYVAAYHDVVPERRIVYSYAMHLSGMRISVSLATIEFEPDGEGTRLIVTEQGAYLDGYEDAGSRQRGISNQMDVLVRVLEEA